MTEELTYSDVFIGECTVGTCTRPATVRVHEDFVLCALHHLHYEAGEDYDATNLALELIAGWHSMANMHGNDYLARMFEAAEEDLQVLRDKAERRRIQAERVEADNIPNEEVRMRMGEKASEERKEDSAENVKGREHWTPEERALWDAQAEEQAWRLALDILKPWAESTERIGSPELERLMEKAVEKGEREHKRALDELEQAES